MKLWAGRTHGQVDALVNDFNVSLSIDKRLYRQDIEGSLVHAHMLNAKGIITDEDYKAIQKGLQDILQDIESGAVSLTTDAEDIHMNIEILLTQRIGEPGKRLHTARSRNDQVALDMRLYVRDEIGQICQLIMDLQRALVYHARQHLNSVMPGYTHLQPAQPVTLAHYLMAYAQMFCRDITRIEDCRKRINAECPLGAGALATTTYPIDRRMTADMLGFVRPAQNSLDAVSDRDFCIELVSALSILMMHMSRLAEELIVWCSWEFGYVEMDDAFATGSSIMPQKKNPDVAELTRGKTGRVYGSLISLLTMMKSLPLAYNKDMQEDKESVFDSIDTAKECLAVFAPMVQALIFKPERMRLAAARGFLNATDCADYLVKKGMAFRDAYRIVGQLVQMCIEQGEVLENLPLGVYQAVSSSFAKDVYDALKLENCVNARNAEGGPAPDAVLAHIGEMEVFWKERSIENDNK